MSLKRTDSKLGRSASRSGRVRLVFLACSRNFERPHPEKANLDLIATSPASMKRGYRLSLSESRSVTERENSGWVGAAGEVRYQGLKQPPTGWSIQDTQ